jgi:hypothetical protein
LRFLVRRRALSQFFPGLMPELVFAPFGLSGLLPEFMGANPYLFFRWLCHFAAFSCERDRFRENELPPWPRDLSFLEVNANLCSFVPGFCRMAKAPGNKSPERSCVNFSRTQDPFNFTKRLGILPITRHSLRIALQNAQDERCPLQICRLPTTLK